MKPDQHNAARRAGQIKPSSVEEIPSRSRPRKDAKQALQPAHGKPTPLQVETTNRNAEFNQLNSDLHNLQVSAKLIFVLLGRDLTLRRYSPEAERQFSLKPADIGKRFRQFKRTFDAPGFEAWAAHAIASGEASDREVRSAEGGWYSLRIRPYLTMDDRIEGAVLVLFDINAVKAIEAQVVHAKDFAEAIIGTARDPFLILDEDLRVQMASEAFYKMFECRPEETLGVRLAELPGGQWAIPSLNQLLLQILPRRTQFNDFEVTYRFEKRGSRMLLLNARTLSQSAGHRKKIMLGIQDVTRVANFETDVRRSELRYRRLFEAARDGILIINPETCLITEANPYICQLLGYTRADIVNRQLWEIGLLRDKAASREAFQILKENGFIRYDNLSLKVKGGKRREVEFVSNLYEEDGEQVIQCNIRDITERKQVEQTLRASEERYRNLFNSMDEGFCIVEVILRAGRAIDFRFMEVNPAFEKQTGLRRAVGRRGREMVPELEPCWLENLGRVVSSGEATRFTDEVKGMGRWFDTYAFRIGGAGSRRVAVLVSNITERKKSDDALRAARAQLGRHAAQLESLVAKRTAQLSAANRKLKTSLESIRKGSEEYRIVFMESENMQIKLRHLAHQMITAQEEERKAISRELHDEVVQTLVGINVELSSIDKATPMGLGALRTKIAHTQRLVKKSVEEVHRFARELRPAVLDDLGLIPALHAFSKNLSLRKKIKIRITAFGGVEAIEADKRTVFFRVAQEALNNVARHAHATLIKVDISKIPDAIRLEVKDDGQSFEVSKTLSGTNNKRLGLLGMRERVEMVGGTLTIESEPGKGTTVRAEIPFSQKSIK